MTTIHDPSNDTSEIMAAAELQRAGKIVALRIYSTTMNAVGSKKTRQAFFFEGNNALFMPEETRAQMEAKAQRYHWVH